ncbi:MAG TPA: hypothetical protein VFY16_12585 [Gemmatimonadaceae bacterium]|nr:hypothetical protein [Gemmatimonadaceae bacterium]
MRPPLAASLRTGTAVAALLLLATGAPWLAHRLTTRHDPTPRTYTPPADRPRLRWEPLHDDRLARPTAFTRVGHALVLVDGRASEAAVLVRGRDDSWHRTATAGRRGDGPGSLRRPGGVAALPGDSTFEIVEPDGRLVRFTLGGQPLGDSRPHLPCTLFEPTLAAGPGPRRFLAGHCRALGTARDTVFTFLFTLDSLGAAPREIARRPRLAANLSWGTVYGSRIPLADAPESVLLATGVDGCAVLVSKRHLTPVTRCGLADRRFRSPPPARTTPDTPRPPGGSIGASPAFAWPDPLPPFVGAAHQDTTVWLVRPISADSAVLVPAGQPFAPELIHLVAPLKGFVGCTVGTCLWVDVARERLALVPLPRLGTAPPR